jgi:predicted esterase
MLKSAGADVTLYSSASGHQLTAPEIEVARKWLVATFPNC